MHLRINGYPVSTPFGAVDEVHATPHKGIDYAMPFGTPVEAVGDGTVTALTDEGSQSFGKAVHLHLDNGTDVIYGHLSEFQCHIGQHVHAGDIVGLAGSTGRSTGPHLHLQASIGGQAVDPSPLVNGDWWQKMIENGKVTEKSHGGSLKDVVEAIHRFCDLLEKIMYWCNPINWFKELYGWVMHWIQSGGADLFMCGVVMAAFILFMLGFKGHIKYVGAAVFGYLVVRGALG